MKRRRLFAGIFFTTGLIAGFYFLHAQDATMAQSGTPSVTDTNVDWNSLSDAQIELMAIEQVSPTPYSQLSESDQAGGTFWSAQHSPVSAVPWPPLPADMKQLSVWSLSTNNQDQNVFLLDDLSVNYNSSSTASSQTAGTMQPLDSTNPPSPGGGGTNSGGGYTPGGSTPIDTNGLWLQINGVSNGLVYLTLNNTTNGVEYQILSQEALSNAPLSSWDAEGPAFWGSETTNWTAVTVPQNGRSNLFLSAQSQIDSTGTGIPDWWWLEYFGQDTNVDAYGDPAGDGWNNLEKFQLGMNPNQFYTPPVPQGLTASYNSYSNTATVSWLPSPGDVTGYTLEKDDSYSYTVQDFNIPAGTESFVDDLTSDPSDPLSGNTINVSYKVQAIYGTNASYWGGPVPLEQNSLSASFIAGPQGSVYVAVSSVPAGTAALRVTRVDEGPQDFYSTNFDLPISASTNGLYLIPASWDVMQPDAYGDSYAYDWFVQTLNTNGTPNAQALAYRGYTFYTEDDRAWLMPPYFDGRAQLKQNLIFLLRAAVVDSPFDYSGADTNSDYYYTFVNPAGYAYAGFYQWDDTSARYETPGSFDAYWPFENNYRYRNFVFNTANLDGNGRITTGVGGNYAGMGVPNTPYVVSGLYQTFPMDYQFQPPTTNGASISPVLATNQTQWLASYALDSADNYLVEIGVTTNGGGTYSMASDARNAYGLPFVSAKIGYYTGGSAGVTTLSAGGYTTQGGYFYPEAAQPQFQTNGYNFWAGGSDYSGRYSGSPLPGMTNFSTSQSSDLLITPVGVSILNVNGYLILQSELHVNGYAKLAVANGYSGVYAYLGQYFTNAYQIDDNGNVTTNTTGLLSPYGQFFATQPGPAALVTMPDPDTGAQGTCTVYAISLVLDKNHDTVMDGSFSGQDTTSQASPDEIWMNDDYDFSSGSADPFGHDVESQYNANYKDPAITCPRDLEDWFRLWICGMPPLPAGQGYSVTMSMSAISGNPAINMVNAAETNGGMLYLTDTNTAFLQTADYMGDGYGQKYQTISSTNTITLPADMFTNSGNKYFLFEGAGVGEGQLTMTIAQNGNTIAQSSAYLDIHEIQDFYERAVITNDTSSSSISNWTSGVEVVQQATASALGDDTNLIVMVHGINVGNWDWLNDSETVFKRLYWSGYHGKFMTVKWPCNYLTPPQPLTLDVFNLSEAKAYKSSTALTTYLNQLRSRFPGYQLNLYVHSQGNAVVSEAIKNGAPVDDYLLTQGALPDNCYDVDAPTYAPFLAQETGTKITPEWQPMGYHGIYTNLTARVINFYNPNDPVLAVWNLDQEDDKPSGYYSYDGTNCWYTDFFFVSHLVTDFQETRAMVSRARSLSVGQSGPDTAHGVIQSGVNLNTQYNFDDAFPADHSAQWTWPIQTTRPYYQQVLRSYQIEPAP